MTDNFNHKARIVVVIAILILLLGFILYGVFSIIEDKDDEDYHMGFSDSAYGYKMVGGPVLLSEIDYSTTCSEGKPKPKPTPSPWSIDPIVMIA